MTGAKRGFALSPAKGGVEGFTLMELMVVVAIFSTAMVAITDMFLISTRAQRKVLGREELASLARASVDQMSRALRQGSIDYARYNDPAEGGPLTTPDSRLYVIAADGTTRSYRLATDGCPPDSSPCLFVEEDGVSALLTPAGARVERFQVDIIPSIDPDVSAGGPYSSNLQPMAWIHLSLRSGSGVSSAAVRLQTAVTTRRYVR